MAVQTFSETSFGGATILPAHNARSEISATVQSFQQHVTLARRARCFRCLHGTVRPKQHNPENTDIRDTRKARGAGIRGSLEKKKLSKGRQIAATSDRVATSPVPHVGIRDASEFDHLINRNYLSPQATLDVHVLLNSLPNIVQRLALAQVCVISVHELVSELGAVI